MPRETRRVITSGRVPKRGRPRLWGYGFADVALLAGVSEAVVRRAASGRTRGDGERQAPRLDMADLVSVWAFIARYRPLLVPTPRRRRAAS
jgi:hypothetical protein